jgi:hypothetical protein
MLNHVADGAKAGVGGQTAMINMGTHWRLVNVAFSEHSIGI